MSTNINGSVRFVADKAIWIVQFLQRFCPAFPAPDASKATWAHFISRCLAVPGIMFVLGLIIACWLLCLPCCLRAGSRVRRSSKKMIFGVLLVLLIAGVGSVVYWDLAEETGQNAVDELSRAGSDVASALQQGRDMQAAGQSIVDAVNALPASCPPAYQSQANQFVSAVVPQVQNFVQQVDSYVKAVGPLPSQVEDAKKEVATVSEITIYGFSIPLLFACLSSIALLFVACIAEEASCMFCCAKCLSPILLVPTVLVLTTAASVQLGVGVVASSFCIDVDRNALVWIQHAAGSDSVAYNVSEYYITGSGTNQLLAEISTATVELSMSQATFGKGAATINTACPSWGKLQNVNDAFAKAGLSLNGTAHILSFENVFPYYNAAIRQDICKNMVLGVGWLALCQACAGLVALPLLSCFVSQYLRPYVVYQNPGLRDNLV
jgi:hypothetical protein